jgi:hypothetical protein
MRLRIPSIPDLRDRCASGSELLVSAPFYSREGLSWVSPAEGGSVEFWSRLNPHDWATGVSNPPALLDYMRSLGEGNVTLRVHRALHAKVYMVNGTWSWVGSPNLSRAAFQRNVELVAEIAEEETRELSAFLDTLRASLVTLSMEQLEAFIAVAEDAIAHFEDQDVSEDLLAAVELVDEVLSPEPALVHPDRVPLLDGFIEFANAQGGAIADEVVAQHLGKQSRQGHVKQCYYAIALFLSQEPGLSYADALRRLDLDVYPRLEANLMGDWVAFLDQNATHSDRERGYSFATLRNILSERLGGYTTGGGGASGTLVRVFPLVAHFLHD